MGYDIQITRKEFWADADGPKITPEEWLSLVENDSELVIEGSNKPYFADWPSLSDSRAWIDLKEKGGYLYSKNPPDEFLVKMYQIATLLGGKVQGQDGEIYDADGNQIAELGEIEL